MGPLLTFLAAILKLPLMILSVVFAIWLLHYSDVLDMSRLTKLGPEGAEFSEKTSDVLIETDSKLRQLEARLAEFEEVAPVLAELQYLVPEPEMLAAADLEPGASGEEPAEQTQQQQQQQVLVPRTAPSISPPPGTVSDGVTDLARAARGDRAADQARYEGYIYVGIFDSTWLRSMLTDGASRQALRRAPQEITPGDIFLVQGNMVLRSDLPPNDADYFGAVARLGIVPRGAEVTAEGPPVGLPRPSGQVEYWMQVSVAEAAFIPG